MQSAVASPHTDPTFHHSQVEPSAPSEQSAALPAADGDDTVVISTQNSITNSSSINRRSTRSVARIHDLDMGSIGVANSSDKKSNKRGQRASTDNQEQLPDEGQTPKRRKTSKDAALPVPSTSTILSASSVIQPPDDAPNWFKTALSMVQSADLGLEWVGFIRQ